MNALHALKELLTQRIDSLEKQVDQHFKYLSESVKTADKNMEIRLEGMNEFRDQIKDERNNYITKDTIKWIIACIAIPIFLSTVAIVITVIYH